MARVTIFRRWDRQALRCDTSKDRRVNLSRILILLSSIGRKLFSTKTSNIENTFSKQACTDYVVVRDDEKRRPGWFEIIEQEISRPGNPTPMAKTWMVNTNKVHHLTQGREIKEAYLVEQPA